MTEALVAYIPAFAGGFVLGTIFYGGLWMTVQRLFTITRPALLMLLSFLLRVFLVLIGFYLIMDGQAFQLLVAVTGFLVTRCLIPVFIGTMGRTTKTSPKLSKDGL